MESNDGRATLPGVHSGANAFGAAGPMQIGIGGAAGDTWGGAPIHPAGEQVGGVATDGNGDGVASVYEPADAIGGAAKYLLEHGVLTNPSGAIFAYNHLTSYVQAVLHWAGVYSSGGFIVSEAPWDRQVGLSHRARAFANSWRARLNSPDRSNGLFGVYVHWPFCAAKCPYCDFNSHVHRGAFDEAAYVEAYKREIGHFARADHGPHGAVDLLRRRHAVADGPALGRADPRDHRPVLEHRSKGRDHARGQPDLGRGRALPRLSRRRRQPRVAGRPVAARRPAGRARPEAHGRRSHRRRAPRAVDLPALELRSHLCASASRRSSDWEDELKEALWLAQGHISLYQLTIEMGTRYFDLWNAGKLKMPDEDLSADFYELTQELTSAAGLPAYEISNHARAGPGIDPQSHLLALRRICRHRPRRPWAAADRRQAPRHRRPKSCPSSGRKKSPPAATA